MIVVTLQEAKAKLNRLVERALAGEQVVLMRGSEIIATIQPLTAEEVEIASKLTDAQAKRFWDEIDKEKKKTFENPTAAIHALKRLA